MVGFNSTIKFRLGKTVATPSAFDAIKKANDNPRQFLLRHIQGDWGDVCGEDKALNDKAVANEGDVEKQQRVLSVYKTSLGQKIWIITEYDRSATTILLPEEY